jgi:VWFA-related protein
LFTSAFAQSNQSTDNPIIRITQVDTSKFPTVTVYISVMDADGNPVGIDPNRLTVNENDTAMVPQQVTGSGDLQELITMLVMDVSGSMGTAGKLEAAKTAALEYIDQMRPNDKAGLISYNTQVKIIQPVTSDKSKLKDAVNILESGGDTSMYDALIQAEFALEPLSGRKAIILLTDGLDNHSRFTATDVLNTIGPSGLSISTIGLGNASQNRSNMTALDEKALNSLAENAGGSYSFVEDPQGLQSLYAQLEKALQSEFAITYTSPSKLRDGLNRILTVSLASIGSGGTSEKITAKYNPGGLIPEVANPRSWGLFIGLLALLLVLLAAPKLVPVLVLRWKKHALLNKSTKKKLSTPKTESKRIKLK